MGFVQSFSAKYFCRFCKSSKSVTATQCFEDINTLRNVHNYEQDIIINDYGLTGIKEKSRFNEIKGFHITTNNSVDIMHNIREGVCIYDLSVILNHFIYEVIYLRCIKFYN